MTGQTIGHYRILDKLGAGGMGEVYLAEDTTLHRRVALKILAPSLAASPDRLDRFEREARILAALDHPHIVTIHSVDEADGIRFLTMAYVEGRTLAELIPEAGLPLPEWLGLALALADGLAAAHERGVVHRDLKPGNVMVDRAGRLRILDFGLAKLDREPGMVGSELPTETGGPGTRAGTILGTYPYMSPEQAEGTSVDARSDIFSLGTMLYEMATGQRPFRGATPAALISSVLKDTPPPVSELRPESPPELDGIVRRCLAKDRNARFQSARAVREALATMGHATGSDGGVTSESAKPGRVRLPRFAAAAVVIALAALGSLLLVDRLPVTDQAPVATGPQAWQQLTFFPDAAVSPALSPDGRMLTFLRGPSTFFGPAQVHVKLLPDGESVPLTDDEPLKMSPIFSPDGSRIAYTIVGRGPNWDTWTVPVFGGAPRQWLANASGLKWIEPGRLLFSQIEDELRMGLVTALESRADTRWIYRPEHPRGMIHRSALSPDGRWVLAAEMETANWLRCRLLPFDGSDTGRLVGPDGPCTYVAWSRDGQWMYFSASDGAGYHGYHLWRQRFPDGDPQQLTAGPTEEEGIALEADERSVLTSVGTRQSTVVIGTPAGERPLAIEGFAWFDHIAHHGYSQPFSHDGSRVYFFRRQTMQGHPDQLRSRAESVGERLGELWQADVATGHAEPFLPGFEVSAYDIAPDGVTLVAEGVDADRRPAVWLARVDRRQPPERLALDDADSFHFGPEGGLFFRQRGPAGNFVWHRSPDGRGTTQVLDEPVLDFDGSSPDGRWLLAMLPGEDVRRLQAFPRSGGSSRPVCEQCSLQWSPGGRYAYLVFSDLGNTTALLSLSAPSSMPELPEGGVTAEDVASLPNLVWRKDGRIYAGADPETYAYSRESVQRNIFRVPIPSR